MTERIWECPSSSGGKFWSCSITGAEVVTRWGKLRSKGQSKTTIHTDEGKAQKFVDTTIRKKEKEGYVEKIVKASAIASAKKSKEEKPVKVSAVAKKTVNPTKNDSDEEVIEPVPTSYVLPALYNKDAKGKERIWKIWVVKNKAIKMHGEVGGKQTLADRSYEGKNIGRSNETDANEQANREAERDWVKQTDKGYKPKTKEGLALYKKVAAEKVKQGGVNTNVAFVVAKELRDVEIERQPLSQTAAKAKAAKAVKKLNNGAMPGYKCELYPMGCQKWAFDPKSAENPEEKVLKYFDFENGVYIQKKLDGIRCLVRIVEDDNKKKWVVMMSRQGNQFVHLKKLRKEVSDFLDGYEDIVLDCEVYADEIYGSITYKGVDSTGKKKVVFGAGDAPIPDTMHFKAISATVRSSMTNPGVLEDQMCLYVFDIVDPTEKLNQEERFEILDELFARDGIAELCPKIVQVERYEINSVEEITKYHDEFAAEGYEGVVLRDKALKYECLKKNKKSKWMRKYKYFLDAEWPIVGVRRDKGVPREQFTWICELDDGTKFYPKPEGTREMKWEWFDNSDDFIGKMLTVRYQGAEDSGKPRFPIGVSIRDFE